MALLRVEPVFRTFIPSPSIVINEFTRRKGSAKIRLSKTNGNLFLLLRCSLTYQKFALTPQILTVHRTPSDRTPNATRSGGGRNLIGRRTVHHSYYISSIDKPLYSMSYLLNLPVVWKKCSAFSFTIPITTSLA